MNKIKKVWIGLIGFKIVSFSKIGGLISSATNNFLEESIRTQELLYGPPAQDLYGPPASNGSNFLEVISKIWKPLIIIILFVTGIFVVIKRKKKNVKNSYEKIEENVDDKIEEKTENKEETNKKDRIAIIVMLIAILILLFIVWKFIEVYKNI